MVGEPRPTKTGWIAMSFAGKAAGKHGKDSGGKGHNMWKENMRALSSNYKGAEGLPYGQWLVQLQHQATTTRSLGPTRVSGLTWTVAMRSPTATATKSSGRVGSPLLHWGPSGELGGGLVQQGHGEEPGKEGG